MPKITQAEIKKLRDLISQKRAEGLDQAVRQVATYDGKISIPVLIAILEDLQKINFTGLTACFNALTGKDLKQDFNVKTTNEFFLKTLRSDIKRIFETFSDSKAESDITEQVVMDKLSLTMNEVLSSDFIKPYLTGEAKNEVASFQAWLKSEIIASFARAIYEIADDMQNTNPVFFLGKFGAYLVNYEKMRKPFVMLNFFYKHIPAQAESKSLRQELSGWLSGLQFFTYFALCTMHQDFIKNKPKHNLNKPAHYPKGYIDIETGVVYKSHEPPHHYPIIDKEDSSFQSNLGNSKYGMSDYHRIGAINLDPGMAAIIEQIIREEMAKLAPHPKPVNVVQPVVVKQEQPASAVLQVVASDPVLEADNIFSALEKEAMIADDSRKDSPAVANYIQRIRELDRSGQAADREKLDRILMLARLIDEPKDAMQHVGNEDGFNLPRRAQIPYEMQPPISAKSLKESLADVPTLPRDARYIKMIGMISGFRLPDDLNREFKLFKNNFIATIDAYLSRNFTSTFYMPVKLLNWFMTLLKHENLMRLVKAKVEASIDPVYDLQLLYYLWNQLRVDESGSLDGFTKLLDTADTILSNPVMPAPSKKSKSDELKAQEAGSVPAQRHAARRNRNQLFSEVRRSQLGNDGDEQPKSQGLTP